MKRLFRRSQPTTTPPRRGQRRPLFKMSRLLWSLFLLGSALIVALGISVPYVTAQSDSSLKQQEDQLIREYTLPSAPAKPPVYKPVPSAPAQRRTPSAPAAPAPAPQPRQNVAPRPRPASPPAAEAPAPTRPTRPTRRPQRASEPAPADTTEDNTSVADTEALPTSQYVMEFNRSPVVGNRFRLRGIYSEARLAFTRPRAWKVQEAKAVIRFQHSPALIADRSNLTVRVNGTSIGSVPLNRRESQVGQVLFNIPSRLLQDYNELSLVAQQQNEADGCSNPGDATLWTEVLPDSKILFDYQPQPIPLNFSRYPYPFFDNLSLDANRIVYLLPKVNETWLTAAPRFQAALGRLADFRPIETRIVDTLDAVNANERLVIIGTPADQPVLKSLDLPFSISQNQILDGDRAALPEDVGVLMLTTTEDGSVPILVATGNGPEGVLKATQFLVQPDTSKLATGQAIIVPKVTDIESPSPRVWPQFLPPDNSFKLSELKTPVTDESFEDITVRGSGAPPIDINFWALPDDQFKRGSSMNLVYSYGPQVNPRTSAVEVLLDGNFIGGARLTSQDGASRQNLRVDLPANLITPTSRLQVAFRLNPREPGVCGQVTDQQLTGTLHADTNFKLNRDISVQLPNLRLLQVGYPFTAPQDLSGTAIVVPASPSRTALLTLMTFSERLGRLSEADSVKLDVYTADIVPSDIGKTHHLVGIGIREQFPFPDVLDSGGFRLSDAFLRQSNQAAIQTLPDQEGVIKEVVSPENSNRVLLALTAQTEEGLERVRQVIDKDPWFFQLREDTVLISGDQQDPASYDPDAYRLEFLERAPSTTRIENTTLLAKASRFLQENWFLLPAGLVAVALLLYGIAQLYLKRLTDKQSKTGA